MTEDELVKKLKDIHVTRWHYSLDGKFLGDDNIIRQKRMDGKWRVFYFERGEEFDEYIFDNEEEANWYIYNRFLAQADSLKRAAEKGPRIRVFELCDSDSKFKLEMDYLEEAFFLYGYNKSGEFIHKEFVGNYYVEAVSNIYNKYGLDPYAWKEDYSWLTNPENKNTYG